MTVRVCTNLLTNQLYRNRWLTYDSYMLWWTRQRERESVCIYVRKWGVQDLLPLTANLAIQSIVDLSTIPRMIGESERLAL